MNGWELFEKQTRGSGMTVSFYLTGSIALSGNVCKALGSDYVKLFYNRVECKVGFGAADGESANAYKLQNMTNMKSKRVNAKAFLRFYELGYLRGNKFEAVREMVDGSDLVVVSVGGVDV